MSDASDAFAEAERRIAQALAEGAVRLDLGNLEYLEKLPESIGRLVNLKVLFLYDTQVADIAPLQNLAALQRLHLSITQVADIAPLQNLPVLQTLFLNSTQVADIAPLQNLSALQTLSLNSTQVADTAPLQYLSALRTLFLDNTQVADIIPLQNLAALQILQLSNTQVEDITPLQNLPALQSLHLDNTQVADIAPLQNLAALQSLNLRTTQVADIITLQNLSALRLLDLDNTQVTDLRPLLALPALGDNNNEDRQLYFSATSATAASPELHALSEIEDDAERIDKTLAFLRTLPPYPKPLPWETTTASAEAKEATPPEITTAQTQIAFVLEHAAVSQATAQQTASQIRFALRDVPATDGNRLPPVLQSMENVAAIFERLGTPTPADTDERSDLIEKVAALEAEVAKLSKLLADETEAKTAAEELLKKDGFWRSYKKSAGVAAGAGTVALLGVSGFTGLVHYLGPGHSLVQSLLTVTGKLPK